MEIIGIVYAVQSAMAAAAVASGITGAILGSRRKIGGAKGLLAGLLLPGIGVLIAAASPKKTTPKALNNSAIHEAARDRAREQFRHDNTEKPRSVHLSNATRPAEKRNRGPKL